MDFPAFDFLADDLEALPFFTLFFLETLVFFFGATFFLALFDFFDLEGVFLTGAFFGCFLAGVLLFPPFLALVTLLAFDPAFFAGFLTGFDVFLVAAVFFLEADLLAGAALFTIFDD